MQNLINILVSTIRAKILPVWIKLKLWLSPSFLRAKVLVKLREFFSKLFDVRPRDKQDYYPVFRWLVSKRLAFALAMGAGVLSLIYILMMLPDGMFTSDEGIPTYKYRSIPLKFYSGTVNILARDGHVAYTGEVAEGMASGEGTLYDARGNIVYSGQFANNMYNGSGALYYAGGSPRYVGEFTDNLYNGAGSYYRPNGVLEYSGGYAAGKRTGAGVLYNSVGSPLYQGNFLNGEILYQDLLARPTSEVAAVYSGESVIWQSSAEYCVAMPDISAVYAVRDGGNTMENEWTVDRVFVLRGEITLENKSCSTLRELISLAGDPLYSGSAWVDLPEAVAWNQMAETQPESPITISASEGLENVFSVSGYDRNFQVYLYSFERSGLVYTFYFSDESPVRFLMYSIELA